MKMLSTLLMTLVAGSALAGSPATGNACSKSWPRAA